VAKLIGSLMAVYDLSLPFVVVNKRIIKLVFHCPFIGLSEKLNLIGKLNM